MTVMTLLPTGLRQTDSRLRLHHLLLWPSHARSPFQGHRRL